MMELLTLWLWPLVALVVLPAMLVYFGLHVVGRGIIFVDLALAQIAALGIATAILLGADPDHGTLPYVLAIGFTLAGAALLRSPGSAIRGYRRRRSSASSTSSPPPPPRSFYRARRRATRRSRISWSATSCCRRPRCCGRSSCSPRPAPSTSPRDATSTSSRSTRSGG
ncbi:MAG: hypothetical protein R2862_05810 [Thermoanaerobaculia bacterium]